MPVTPMFDRWSWFWESLLGIQTYGNPSVLFVPLEKRYNEHHRRYHNFEHIARCLDLFHGFHREHHLLKRDRLLIEMAIWYHDAVYDIRAKDNEERSAELVVEDGRSIFLSEDFLADVKRLVLTTKHVGIPERQDEQILCDIDLAGLGQPWEEFRRDGKDIREEYRTVVPADAEFNAGRAAFLGRFLGRPHIYQTSYFQAKYEDQAVKNITRLISFQGEPTRSA